MCGRLTVTDRVTGWRAFSQLCLGFLVTDGAGQAGVEVAVLLRESIVHTFLTHGIVVVFAVTEHTLSRRANRARLALPRHQAEEVVVVADADGVVGVGAGCLHPHQARALSAGPTLLRVAVVLRERLTCGREDEGKERRGKGG